MTTKQKFYSYIEELCAYAIADCEVNDKKADEFWGWFKLKMEEAYKRGREDEAIGQKDMERVVEETRREVVEEVRDWIEQNRDERPDKLFSTDSKGGNYELGRRDENIVLINELVKILDKLALSSDGEKKGTK